jgi:hypothetical protein
MDCWRAAVATLKVGRAAEFAFERGHIPDSSPTFRRFSLYQAKVNSMSRPCLVRRT